MILRLMPDVLAPHTQLDVKNMDKGEFYKNR